MSQIIYGVGWTLEPLNFWILDYLQQTQSSDDFQNRDPVHLLMYSWSVHACMGYVVAFCRTCKRVGWVNALACSTYSLSVERAHGY